MRYVVQVLMAANELFSNMRASAVAVLLSSLLFLTVAMNHVCHRFQLCTVNAFVLQQVQQQIGRRAGKVAGQQRTDREPIDFLALHAWTEYKGAAVHAMSNEFFALHNPEDGLNSFVIWGWDFVGRLQDFVNGAFPETPQDFQEAQFGGGR